MATSQRSISQEEKFRHDEETGFKIKVRRNKLLGLWAADKMGLSGDDAAAYAKEVVSADFLKPGDDDVVEKIVGDLKNRGAQRFGGGNPAINKSPSRGVGAAEHWALNERRGPMSLRR